MGMCIVDGCNNKVHGNGYCSMHYMRIRRHGDSNYEPKPSHGKYKTKEYMSWFHMIQRCYNKNSWNYNNYGGRGIIVCDRWIESFENFLEDMGTKDSPEMQIDRIDNDGNYCKDNCRWSTPSDNSRNRRTTILDQKKVCEIRLKYAQGKSASCLAREYKCSRWNIRDVVNYKSWKDV
jgi:hypothetical protein